MLLATLLRDDAGQGLAEYAFILACVAAACVTALVTLGGRLPPLYSGVMGGFH